MAVIHAYNRQAFGETTIELSPPSGRSRLVTNIEVIPGAAQWLTITIGRRLVGYYNVGPGHSNNLTFERVDVPFASLIQEFVSRGLFAGYPIADGETLTLTFDAAATVCAVTYIEGDEGEFLATMLNGSDSKDLLYVGYGANAAQVTSAAYTAITNSLNPAQFSAFPFGEDVPALTEATILAIMARVVEENTWTGAANTYARSERLRITREREIQFDPSDEGFLVHGDGAAAGSANAVYNDGSGYTKLCYRAGDWTPLMYLPEPLVLVAGEEVLQELAISKDGACPGLTAGYFRMAYILHFHRV